MQFSFTNQFKKDLEKLKKENPKLPAKVFELIFSIEKNKNNPLGGIGNPEFLKGNMYGSMSRHINQKHRLIYEIMNSGNIILLSCYGHYSDR
jgi:toxin YoeB